jgi:uncharacterized protein YndB with AHSA1/START domain
MLTKILIGLAVVVIGLVAIVAVQPSEFRIARTATVAAPAGVVFAQVNDFRKWDAWNALKQGYEGPPAGKGAVYTWAGNSEVGEGRMTISESRPNELIRIQMEFLKPFQGRSTAEFTFKPEGDRTAVTWSMVGEHNFIAKAMHLVMNLDKMVGGNFEKGLAQMKSVAEAAARQ